jgi:FAD/FMN-containing dehydrogenase
MTSSVGGTLGVGGIDVNSARLGCSADQALALQVVTPTGEIVECSDGENAELFQRVILGYGQFGVITESRCASGPTPRCACTTTITRHCARRSRTCNCSTATTPATTPASSPSWTAR